MTPSDKDRPPSKPQDAAAIAGGGSDPRHDPTTPLEAARPPADIEAAEQPSFGPGDVVAGRYRIVRFMAQGGMGQVYEAEDLELKGRVALKTLRPDIAADARAVERFKREIQLARQVTHPNVCRIFDVGFHRVPASPSPILFLTMELLSGESLADRLHRTGRMQTGEAFPLVRQMAAALEAAHRVGVVHRDFKSSNVILVGDPALAGGELRVVVTDFGLARTSAAGEHGPLELTRAGEMIGSPLYMAPEQIEGGAITPAADLYALGVVLYEMVTGTWPFVAQTPLATAVQRLKADPSSPRSHVPDLDPRWEAAILRCLRRDPAQRFTGAEGLVQALGGVEPSPLRRRGLWKLGAVAAAAALLVAGVLLIQKKTEAPPASAPAARSSRPSIAVLGFQNLSGRPDAAWYSTALALTLSTQLAAGDKLRTIPGENVARMKNELALADADSLALDTLTRIRKHLDADFVVLGSYLVLDGGKLRVNIRVQDAQAGETRIAVSETGSLEELLASVGVGIRERLGVGALSAEQKSGARAALPASPEAVRLYSEGLEKLHRYEDLAARDLLERAAAVEPKHPLIHHALSEVFGHLSYETRAKQEAKQAFDLSANLPRAERLLVEARYRQENDQEDKALEIYRTLFGYDPENLEYGLYLAEAQAGAAKAKEALDTVQKLRKLPAPAANDPRIDLAEAGAAMWSDARRAHEALSRAADKGRARGSQSVVAHARVMQYWTLWLLGDQEKGSQALEEAKQIYASIGDRGGLARTLAQMAARLGQKGDWAGARRLDEEVLAVYRAMGEQRGIARMTGAIAASLRQQGDLGAARRKHEEALALWRQLGEKSAIASQLVAIARLRIEQGELATARKQYQEAIALVRQAGDAAALSDVLAQVAGAMAEHGDLASARSALEEAITLEGGEGKNPMQAAILSFQLADLLIRQGDLAGARSAMEQVIARCRAAGNMMFVGVSTFFMADIVLRQGDLAGARKLTEQALEQFKSIMGPQMVVAYRVGLARVLLEEGQPAQAEEIAQASVKALDLLQVPPMASIQGLDVLARAQLAQGKLAPAQATIASARERAKRVRDPSARGLLMTLELTGHRVRAAAGQGADVAAALKALSALLAEAQKRVDLSLELETRLALGEIELHSGRAAAGRARLEALEREATRRGFGLIAKKAAALR